MGPREGTQLPLTSMDSFLLLAIVISFNIHHGALRKMVTSDGFVLSVKAMMPLCMAHLIGVKCFASWPSVAPSQLHHMAGQSVTGETESPMETVTLL